MSMNRSLDFLKTGLWDMKQKKLRIAGAIALYFENYILPWSSVSLVYGIASAMYVDRTRILQLLHAFSIGELQQSQTFLFLHFIFLIAMMIYNLTIAFGLLTRKKFQHKFESFKEILLPFASCFYYYLFNLALFLPPETNILLIPDFFHRYFTIFGVAMMVAGFLISTVGIFNLGNSFALFVETRGVVTRGLYQFTRHPIYFGHFIRTVGMCFAVCLLFHVTVNILVIYLLVHRALLEEKKLLHNYPHYKTYLKKTPSFFLRLFGKDKQLLENTPKEHHYGFNSQSLSAETTCGTWVGTSRLKTKTLLEVDLEMRNTYKAQSL